MCALLMCQIQQWMGTNTGLEAHYVPITQAMKSLFGDPSFKGNMHYVPEPTFNEDGERVLGGMHTGIASGATAK